MYIHTHHNILYSRTCTHLARMRNDLARTCHHFARICQDCARIAPFPRPLCTHARTSVHHATHFLLCPHRRLQNCSVVSDTINLLVVLPLSSSCCTFARRSGLRYISFILFAQGTLHNLWNIDLMRGWMDRLVVSCIAGWSRSLPLMP